MFAFLTRGKAAVAAAEAKADAAYQNSAEARRRRVFDRTIVASEPVPEQDKLVPRDTFGLKPADD